MNHGTTITQFMAEEQRNIPGATGDFSALLSDIITACKMISNQVNHGALVGALGSAESENVQGEIQKELDILSNEMFIQCTEWSGHVSGLASEEMDDIYMIPDEYPRGKYLLTFDPLDGSSNIDINVSVGTIFSVLRREEAGDATEDDFLQPGLKQVAAGYALYGPSTMLVLTTGKGVNGFTLDQNIGEFILTHPDMHIPPNSAESSINASNSRFWEAPVKRYVDECLAGAEGPREKDFNMRWVASMVAEVHRILTRGGVFLYPMDSKMATKGLDGKLRLLYEANPMSFIVEQAGGMAITGKQRIMELEPQKLHQRVPVILGSRNEIECLQEYHNAE